jgi:DNA-binding MarR family transcriptional regulator
MDTQCICSIRDIYRAIASFEAELEKTVGINMNEAMLLCVLSEKANLLSGEIADELGLTRSNASKVIASLEKSACIRRRACKEDSRCQRFNLTKKGQQLLEQIHAGCIQLPAELQPLTTGQTLQHGQE